MKIYGVFDQNRENDELITLLRKMELQLNPESYWESNNYVAENAGFGHIYSEHITQDKQPIWNESNDLFILLAGKIFDYDERKKKLIENGHIFRFPNSDAEFVLHGFEEWGFNLLSELNGFFVFVLVDDKNKKIMIVNDKCGMKPLYFFHSNSFFVFASEVKAIITDDKVTKKVNWEAWRDFFSYGFMIGKKTPFENVFSLPASTILTFLASGDLSLKNYWDYSQIEVDYESSEQLFIQKGAKLIRKAIQRQTKNVSDCIVLLSGGYDSRLLASAINYYTNLDFETFTTRPSHFIDSRRPLINRLIHFLDQIIAKEVAKALKVKNTFVERPNDLYFKHLVKKVFLLDGMSLEHLWMLPLLSKLKKNKLNFDGLAGDMLLIGFDSPKSGRYSDVDLALFLDHQLRDFLGFYPTETIISFFKNPIHEKLIPSIDPIINEIETIGNHENTINIFYLKNRTKNSVSLLPNNLIGKRAFCMFPFLDTDLVNFSLTIPVKIKWEKKIYRKMISKMFPEIMTIPTTHASLSSLKQWRIKHLLLFFSLLSRFIKSRTSSYTNETNQLLTILNSLEIPEYLDFKKIRKTVHVYLNNRKNPIPFLVPIIEFCIWYNTFVKNKRCA